MKWKIPPIIKVYEALGAVADNRIKIEGDTTKVFSSSGNKFYEVFYDPKTQSIMTNDNGSYWKNYLGYPSITFLLKINVLPYKPEYGELMKGIAWKDINQKFKNDFDKTLNFILSSLTESQKKEIAQYTENLLRQIKNLNLNLLGKKTLPPQGY